MRTAQHLACMGTYISETLSTAELSVRSRRRQETPADRGHANSTVQKRSKGDSTTWKGVTKWGRQESVGLGDFVWKERNFFPKGARHMHHWRGREMRVASSSAPSMESSQGSAGKPAPTHPAFVITRMSVRTEDELNR